MSVTCKLVNTRDDSYGGIVFVFFRSFAYFCIETPEGTKIMASPRLVFAVGSIIPIVPMESAACRPVQ